MALHDMLYIMEASNGIFFGNTIEKRYKIQYEMCIDVDLK